MIAAIDAAIEELRHASLVDAGRVIDILLDLRSSAVAANLVGELWAAQEGSAPGLSDC